MFTVLVSGGGGDSVVEVRKMVTVLVRGDRQWPSLLKVSHSGPLY